MRRAGLVVWEAHQAAAPVVAPGATTGDIDRAIAEVFRKHGAEPLFLGYRFKGHDELKPFPAVTCVSVNDEIVHGIPSGRVLREGDVVSVDTGARLDGWCGDAAVSYAVGRVSEPIRELLLATEAVLQLSIRLLGECRWWSQVASEMQQYIEARGFGVVEDFVGHGIGRELHEDPEVPNYFADELREKDFEIRPGLVLAIEPMVNLGSAEVRCRSDRWTQVSADGSPSAHFEHTVAITREGPVVLTCAPGLSKLDR